MGNLILFRYWLDATLKNNKIVKRFVKEDRGTMIENIMWLGMAVIIGGLLLALVTNGSINTILDKVTDFFNTESTTINSSGTGTTGN